MKYSNQILRLQRIFWMFFARWPGSCKCIICGHSVARFLPYQGGKSFSPPLMQELDVVGSDIENFECPRCGSHDRERHLILYFERAGLFKQLNHARVLHFAPEKYFSQKIQESTPISYIKADLYPSTEYIEKIDMQELPFESSSLDFVIANHVLEHVRDDKKALSEITRVLTPGGTAILQTPFSRKLRTTLEDPGIHSASARLHAYGQEDHVRLYGQDWLNYFESFGLSSSVKKHEDLLTDIDPFIHGVNAAEPFMWFVKR